MKPTPDQARQFAIMLQAGLPARDAIRYFAESDDQIQVSQQLQEWQRSREVARAMSNLMGKSWQDMNLDEKINHALDLHYSALAYFLFSNNYSDLEGSDKAKADTARQALEARLAGTAGKGDALSQFFDDINRGRIKLSPPAPVMKPN